MKDDQRVLYVRERENFVLNSLIHSGRVKRFKNRRNVMKFESFGDSTSSSI
jgi:hypothetical protein